MKLPVLFSLLLVVVCSVSASRLNYRDYHLKMDIDMEAFRMPAFIGASMSYGEGPGSSGMNPAVSSSIQTGIRLGGLGTTVWSIGCLLQIITVSQAISSMSDNKLSSEEASSLANLSLWATVLSVLGPLPSCIGESVAIGTLNASRDNYSRYYTRGWSSYGVSWIFTGTSVVFSSLANSGSDGAILGLIGSLLGLTAEAFRGRAAILPIINLSGIKARLSGNIGSDIDGGFRTGAGLSFTF